MGWWSDFTSWWDGFDIIDEGPEEQAREQRVRDENRRRKEMERQAQRNRQNPQAQYYGSTRGESDRARRQRDSRRDENDRSGGRYDDRDREREEEKETQARHYDRRVSQYYDPYDDEQYNAVTRDFEDQNYKVDFFDDAHTEAFQTWYYSRTGRYVSNGFATEMGDIAEDLGIGALDFQNNLGNLTSMVFDMGQQQQFQGFRSGNPSQSKIVRFIKSKVDSRIGRAYQVVKKRQEAEDLQARIDMERSRGNHREADKLEKEQDRRFREADEIEDGKDPSALARRNYQVDDLAGLSGYEHIFRLARKYKEDGPRSLTPAEKKLLLEGKKDLHRQLKEKSFLQKLFGDDDDAIRAGIETISDAVGGLEDDKGLEEEVLDFSSGILDDFQKAIDEIKGTQDKATKEGDNYLKDEEKRQQALEEQLGKDREFYEKRLGASDALHEEGIQSAKAYAKSPSIVAETMRRALDSQIKGQAKAYDASNRRFGTGGTLADLNRQRQARDIDLANQSGVAALAEKQEKQKYLTDALTRGATERMGLADFGTLRGFLGDQTNIGSIGSRAKQYQISNLYKSIGGAQDRASLTKDIAFSKQNLGTADFNEYMRRLSQASDKASQKNWQAAGAATNALSSVFTGSLGDGWLSNLLGGKGDDKKEEK